MELIVAFLCKLQERGPRATFALESSAQEGAMIENLSLEGRERLCKTSLDVADAVVFGYCSPGSLIHLSDRACSYLLEVVEPTIPTAHVLCYKTKDGETVCEYKGLLRISPRVSMGSAFFYGGHTSLGLTGIGTPSTQAVKEIQRKYLP